MSTHCAESGIGRHILSFVSCLFLFLALVYFTSVNTLSFVLSRQFPDYAIRLNNHNTTALIAKTSELASKVARASLEKKADTPQRLKDSNQTYREKSTEGDLKKSIQKLRDALAFDPLSAAGFRLLGQVYFSNGMTQQGKQLEAKASDLSSQEILAHDFMFKASIDDKKYGSALKYANRLFSMAPDLLTSNIQILDFLLQNKDAQKEFLQIFSESNSWRLAFFSSVLPKLSLPGLNAAAALFATSNFQKNPLTSPELNALLYALNGKGEFDLAYKTWLQYLPPERADLVDLLSNGSFEFEPSGAPFDWIISGGTEASAKIGFANGAHGERGLNIEFGYGRVVFPSVYQYTMLAPGHYRFQGLLRGELAGRRGLQWIISCADGRLSGESEMILGRNYRWRKVEFDFDIPQGCNPQRVNLIHDARSPSEQIITGSIWFDNLSIVRLDNDNLSQR